MSDFKLTLFWVGEGHGEEIEHIADDSGNGDPAASRFEIGVNFLVLFYEDAERCDVEHVAEDCIRSGDDPADRFEIVEV